MQILYNSFIFKELPPYKVVTSVEKLSISAVFAFFELFFSFFSDKNKKNLSFFEKFFPPFRQTFHHGKTKGKGRYLEKRSPAPENCRKVRGEDRFRQ